MTNFVLENRSFNVYRAAHSLSENEITAFEGQIGTQLPFQLRSFYLHWNGGLPYPTDIPDDKSAWVRLYWAKGVKAAQGGPAACFQGLFRINEEPAIDFLRTWNDFKHRIPQDVLCFARDPGGSQFVIGIKEYNLGKIFFWDRDYEADIDDGETPNYDNIAFVANSFTEFLLALREEPDEGESLEDWVKRVYTE